MFNERTEGRQVTARLQFRQNFVGRISDHRIKAGIGASALFVVEDLHELQFPMERFNVRSARTGNRFDEPRLARKLGKLARCASSIDSLLILVVRQLMIYEGGRPEIGQKPNGPAGFHRV